MVFDDLYIIVFSNTDISIWAWLMISWFHKHDLITAIQLSIHDLNNPKLFSVNNR